MKQSSYITLSLCTFFLLTFLSCTKKDDIIPDAFKEISDIATFHGNLEGNIVVINTQGGPETQLDDETLNEFIYETQAQAALFVNVHQEQTKNPSQFTASDITFDQAKEFDTQSVATLKRVVNFFKNQFRHLNFYSLPTSILFVLRKRLNFITNTVVFLLLLLFSIL